MVREGLFVVSLYADREDRGEPRGEIERMTLLPSGALIGGEAVAVALHLAEVQADVLRAVLDRFQEGLDRFQEGEERGALDQDCLPARKPERGKGSRFDASA